MMAITIHLVFAHWVLLMRATLGLVIGAQQPLVARRK